MFAFTRSFLNIWNLSRPHSVLFCVK